MEEKHQNHSYIVKMKWSIKWKTVPKRKIQQNRPHCLEYILKLVPEIESPRIENRNLIESQDTERLTALLVTKDVSYFTEELILLCEGQTFKWNNNNPNTNAKMCFNGLYILPFFDFDKFQTKQNTEFYYKCS